jgi:mRNA interferase MazF
VIVQSDPYNRSRLATTIGVVVTSNTALAAAPGNVFLPAAISGLPRDSVANVTAPVCIDRTLLDDPVGHLPADLLDQLDVGLRRVLGLR